MLAIRTIKKFLNKDQLMENEPVVSRQLGELFNIITVHLGMEDVIVYPNLLNHSNIKVRDIAQRFIEEMGYISKTFADYRRKYESIRTITDSPEHFIGETNSILSLITNRIEAEEKKLYPMLDV
jgi:hemerythrin-like domain-containing protein